jgi:activator of HSP90 ATPase
MEIQCNLEPKAANPTRRQTIAGLAFGILAMGTTKAWGAQAGEISHASGAIHQEPVFTASPQRVYEALLDAKQFNKVIELSGVMQTLHLPNVPVEISPDEGGPFKLFGGYITGRNVELIPAKRIVQAWRAGSWDVGIYSIARFDFVENGSGTRIAFDHTGFPNDAAESLASGWKKHYWEPLQKLLA